MSDNLYQIQNGAVTLHVDVKYDGVTFEFKGFTIAGDENFYQTYTSSYDAVVPCRSAVFLRFNGEEVMSML
jgi:hypothetical protein